MKTAPGDDLTRRRIAILFWWLPVASLVLLYAIGATRGVSWATITSVFTISFTLIGAGCAWNAVRCGRVHCYFTAPLFLLLAAVSLLNGLRVIETSWSVIANVAFVGGMLLLFVPEWLLGKYRRRG